MDANRVSLRHEDILKKFFMQLDSKQQPVGFQGKESDPTYHNTGIEDKINCLRQVREENLQNFRAEELPQLENKLEQKLQYVRAIKDYKQKADAIGGQSSNLNNHESASYPYSEQTVDPSAATNYLERWTAPFPPNIYKVNFAGTVFQNGSGIGVVIRDWRGEFMAALARFFPDLMDLNIVSSVAATRAIEFANAYSFTHIVLEGDAFNTIRELKHTYESQQLGINCAFSYIQRSGNNAAHMMAQYARNVQIEAVWIVEAPHFLAHVLRADQGLQPSY